MDTTFRVVPRFIQGSTVPLFIIEYLPRQSARGIVVFVPSFAEEMNRSRKMASLQARVLAGSGFHVVIPDLRGTGDSHGAFAENTWDGWCDDLNAAIEATCGDSGLPVTLLAHRLGALLAADVLRASAAPVSHLILWSPVLNGRNFLTQFLRLRLMSSLVGKSDNKESVADLKSRLESGESVEVAGYDVSPALFRGLDALVLLDRLAGTTQPVSWFEMVSSEGSAIPLQAASGIKALSAAGSDVTAHTVVGPKFWSTVETTVSDRLARETLRAIEGCP